MTRRQLHRLLGVFALALALAPPAIAQTYPNRTIRIIVPHAPGGAVDVLARGVAAYAGPLLGQSVIVENRPGASGIIGTEACAKAAPDGYTLCLTNNDSIILNPLLYSKLPYNPERELAPVAKLGTISGIMIANTSVPANTVAELVEQGKKKPESVRWSTFGNGSIVHVYSEWLSNSMGASFLPVHYKGAGPALQAVLSGEVDASMFGIGPVVQHIRSGRLKPLAILGAKRSPLFPEVPTFVEQGFPFFITAWLGLFAPQGTPAAAIEKLNAVIQKVASDPAFKKSILDIATVEFTPGSADDFSAYIHKNRQDVEQIVRSSKVRMD